MQFYEWIFVNCPKYANKSLPQDVLESVVAQKHATFTLVRFSPNVSTHLYISFLLSHTITLILNCPSFLNVITFHTFCPPKSIIDGFFLDALYEWSNHGNV